MDGRFNNIFLSHEQEDSENSPENSLDSPRSDMFNDNKMMTSTSSPKRRSVSYTFLLFFSDMFNKEVLHLFLVENFTSA